MPIPDLAQRFERLISLPSVSSCDPDIDSSNLAVITQLAEWLEAIGFRCEIQPLRADKNKANLIASLGEGPGGLVLSGHTDTVPYDDRGWDSEPLTLTERNDRLYGLGSSDMKGFFSMAIEAARHYRANDLDSALVLLATADEESSMQGARELVEHGSLDTQPRCAIIGEPTNLRPIRMHKGIMMERVKIHGRSGHSSDPALGNSALEAMRHVLNTLVAFRDELQKRYRSEAFSMPVPTLNLGCVHGGDNPNRICNSCELQFDLRALPGMSNSDLRGQIGARLEHIAKQENIGIEYSPLVVGAEPYEESEHAQLVQLAEQLTDCNAGSAAFATEAPFLQQLGMETVVLGPGSIDVAHQANEYIELQQIQPYVKLLRQFIEAHCQRAH